MLPRITVSLPRSPFLGRKRLLRVATLCGADGIDFDLQDRFGRIGHPPGPGLAVDGVPVVSISLEVSDLELLNSDRMHGFQPPTHSIQSIIVKLPAADDSRVDHAAANAVAKFARSWLPTSASVLSVSAVVNDDGRAHLARMRRLTRLTEEWDFTVGIELDRRADPKWEAEAAVHIAGERLAFVRFSTSAFHPRKHRGDLAMRVLRACADADFGGSIAIMPDVSLWQARSPNTLADSFSHHRGVVRHMFLGHAAPMRISHDQSVHLR
jgi:hypothetical protein